MKKLGLLLVGLLCLSIVVYAGDVITNDTGEDATGLRVSFSTPVLITAFGDILTSVDPQMLSFEFVFSGGTVKPWESQWFNYAPTTASVLEIEWLAVASSTDADTYPAVASASTPSVSDVNWEEVPKIITYPREAPVEYYCNGDEDLANARFWNRSGSEIETLRLSMTDSSLLLGVELYEGNSLDYYDYVISFYLPSRDRISLWRTTSQDRLTVTYFPQSNDDVLIHIAEGLEYGEVTDAFYGVIPLAAVLEYASRSELCDASIEISLFRSEEDCREYFIFSTPTKDTLSCIPGTEPASSISVATTPSKTYEEIMAEIAQDPGPDEPLYIPAEDEAIWLTDLEGHADIYDNDSIKINYADWFDQSQITKINVYRNGVKMEFLPEMLDVVNNGQMKTFSASPGENSPSSTHTDHAIFGYQFEFAFQYAEGVTKETVAKEIRSRIRYVPDVLHANIMSTWILTFRQVENCDEVVLQKLVQLREMGFTGISLDIQYFVDSLYPSTVFPVYETDDQVTTGISTATSSEILAILELAELAGLDADLRLQIQIDQRYKDAHGGHRGELEPEDLDAFFAQYSNVALHLAELAEEGGADIFCPFVETDTLLRYKTSVSRLLDRISEVFTGDLAIDEGGSIWNIIDTAEYGRPATWEYADIWDWMGKSGDPLQIHMSCWTPRLDTTSDQRLSSCAENFVDLWTPSFEYYSTHYPEHPLMFGEMGTYNFDGQAQGSELGRVWVDKVMRGSDYQEFADIWAAYLIGACALGADGVFIWNLGIGPWELPEPGHSWISYTPAQRVIQAICGELPYQPQTSLITDSEASAALLEMAAQLPETFPHLSEAAVEFYCNGITDIRDSQFQGTHGYRVSKASVAIAEDKLFFSTTLAESEQFGDFEYRVSFYFGSGGFLACALRPDSEEVFLHYVTARGQEREIRYFGSPHFAMDNKVCIGAVPLGSIENLVGTEDICSASVEFSVTYPVQGAWEFFIFTSRPAYPVCGSRDVEVLGIIPSIASLQYSEAVRVRASLDGVDVPLSETMSWELSGGNVQFVKASVSSGDLLIELELHTDGLTSGNFEAYALDLHLPSGDHVYVSLIPEDRSAILEYYDGTTNKYVDTIRGSSIFLSPQRMSAAIPISRFSPLVSEEELCGATFSLILEAFPGNHHEVFWFPGEATIDCQP